MALDPLPPPLLETLTQKPTHQPPKKPPDPSISALFPERTPYRAPNNPFREPIPKETEEEYKRILKEVLDDLRSPFCYDDEGPYSFDGSKVGVDLSSENFNAAVITVLAAVERGYYPTRDPTPLNTRDWARLACALISAIGRGYHRPNTSSNETMLDKVREEAIDENPVRPGYHTLFHRLTAAAEHLDHCVHPDVEDYQSWYLHLRDEIGKDMTKLATKEVEEKWREWKADQIDRRAADQEAEIATAVRNRNCSYFMSAALSLGLNAVFEGPFDGPRPVPTTGKKRTASGATPAPGPATPVSNRIISPSTDPSPAPEAGPSTPRATRLNPPRAAKRPSPSTTPRGRPAAQVPTTPSRLDPSPTPRSKKSPPKLGVALGETRVQTSSFLHHTPAKPSPTGQMDAAAIMAAVQAAVQASMNPIVTRLNALERASMPPPQTPKTPRRQPVAANREEPQEPSRTIQAPKAWPPSSPAGPSALPASSRVSDPSTITGTNDTRGLHRTDQEFIPVKRRNRKKKGKNWEDQGGPTPQAPWINITPTSYAGVAAAATNVQQNTTAAKPTISLPSITEVTVLRFGGFRDTQVEDCIRVRAADAIVREVRVNMGKAVARPIPLRAGRWSVQPRSKGNFVYSFDGHIPFDVISSYEHILLKPFQGSGQLCPSLGWTRLLAHGVPVLNNEDTVFGPESLLAEVRSLPGLKKAFFAMPPRWLRPVGNMSSCYSTITFAISDPDGTVTKTLLSSRTALFGKDVKIQKWIDKPMLTQCSRCHALGHHKASKACTLSRDSVKCFICGGAHKSEEHNQRCLRKHVVAGVCDCTHYKCLNCQQPGHHCREEKCPSRALFRPRNTRRAEKARDKGKGRDPAEGPGLPPAQASIEEINAPDYDPFNLPLHPPPPPSIPQGPQTRAARRQLDANSPLSPPQDMEVDRETPAGSGTPSETSQTYSPSRPQPGAAVVPMP